MSDIKITADNQESISDFMEYLKEEIRVTRINLTLSLLTMTVCAALVSAAVNMNSISLWTLGNAALSGIFAANSVWFFLRYRAHTSMNVIMTTGDKKVSSIEIVDESK